MALLLVIAVIVAGTTRVPAMVGEAIGRVAGEEGPVDSDGDGIPDQVETSGWRTQSGTTVHRTDPDSRDSDGDGLTDADEAGSLVGKEQSGSVYVGLSDPGLPDTDDDGLGDADEADLTLDPFNGDSDGDGLQDGREVEVVGSDPDTVDTDGDGYDDGFEDADRTRRGLDPLWFDVRVSRRSYITDFAKGAVLGDARREDTLAWLAGNLTSGAASSIPVVGSVVGGLADVRDAISSAVRADWVGSGYSALGAVPGGDAVAIPGKAAKFVARNPLLAASTAHLVVKAKKVPRKYKVKAATLIWKNWDALKETNASDQALLTLQQGRTNLDDLAAARERPMHVEGAPGKFFPTSADGESFLEGLYGSQEKGADKKVRVSTEGCADGCNSNIRLVDVLVDGVAHESRVGHVVWSPATQSQIKRDAWLIKTRGVEGAHWHFFASSFSNTLGADEKVLDLLEEQDIPYTIHLPA